MANKITFAFQTGQTLYLLLADSSDLYWNGTTVETYAAGNYSTYDIALTENGGSGIYTVDFPATITDASVYTGYVKRQAGGSPAESDPIAGTITIDFNGTVAAQAAAGAMSGSDFYDYILRCGFKRTDKETETYEAITDAVQEMRRREKWDEAARELTTTDTITIDGDFKIDLESDFGILQGIVVEDDTDGWPMNHLSPQVFDARYPDINVTSDRGVPLDYKVLADAIYVGAIPDKTTYVFRMTYYQIAGTITSGTTAVPFTAIYRDVLKDLVLAKLYISLGNEQLGAQFLALHERAIEQGRAKEYKNAGRGNFAVRCQDC